MKLLQGCNKRNTPAASAFSGHMARKMTGHIHSYQNILGSRWQALLPRDQMALGLLLVFLLLFGGGYGGYILHQAAEESEVNYQEQVADYFWLRAQADNIDSNVLNAANTPGVDTSQSPASSISSLLNASGIDNAQVVAAGEAVQLSFADASQAIVSAALGKLQQQGWQFTQLSMQQDITTKQIQVQATVTY
ncbi:type II secretion system protein GspM [Psychrobacter sp. CAL346-MNA-CIBAN-0220]|uniref:type II secretion system protein GspM n=1 Tax=Psychrobacter sp. CAL346-MNA-CIBAN-0220 TaxID=3140457 RepID=UPI003329E310